MDLKKEIRNIEILEGDLQDKLKALNTQKMLLQKTLKDEEIIQRRFSGAKNLLNRFYVTDILVGLKNIPTESIDIIVTSPPYNNETAYAGHNDFMAIEKYVDWQKECISEMMRVLHPNGAIFYNFKQRIRQGKLSFMFYEIIKRFPVRQLITWKRPSGLNHQRRFFCPLSEQIAVIAKPDFAILQDATKMGDVWEFPFETNTKNNNQHPTPFPLELPRRCIAATGARIVLDPFMGSGTTAIAAKEAGAHWIGFDNSAFYVEMSRKRYAEYISQISE